MSKPPSSPRLDALRAMREQAFDEAAERQRREASNLKEATVQAIARSDAADARRKAKKAAKKSTRRGNNA